MSMYWDSQESVSIDVLSYLHTWTNGGRYGCPTNHSHRQAAESSGKFAGNMYRYLSHYIKGIPALIIEGQAVVHVSNYNPIKRMCSTNWNGKSSVSSIAQSVNVYLLLQEITSVIKSIALEKITQRLSIVHAVSAWDRYGYRITVRTG